MSATLEGYENLVRRTDRLPSENSRPALLGLFGEIGEVLTTAKKLVREGDAYLEFRKDAIEEFGDALWYLTALCIRLGVSLADLMPPEAVDASTTRGASSPTQLHDGLLSLFRTAAELNTESPDNLNALPRVAGAYLDALGLSGLGLGEVIDANVRKISSRFLPLDELPLLRFDETYPDDEQLPESFQFKVAQRPSGQMYMSLNGVFVGDALTDNIWVPDGYRFHDVFHMANAAILHWSPVLRSLLKRKRKSDPRVDEAQDGGRAIVVEEGLTAWIFSQAKPFNLFSGADSISYDILKRIEEFVAGYEVEQCPVALWERSILQGFEAFRALKERESGYIIGNRTERTLRFAERI